MRCPIKLVDSQLVMDSKNTAIIVEQFLHEIAECQSES